MGAKTKDWLGKVLEQNGIGKCWKKLCPPTLIEYATRPISALGRAGDQHGMQVIRMTEQGPDLSNRDR